MLAISDSWVCNLGVSATLSYWPEAGNFAGLEFGFEDEYWVGRLLSWGVDGAIGLMGELADRGIKCLQVADRGIPPNFTLFCVNAVPVVVLLALETRSDFIASFRWFVKNGIVP
jgi:hypothetical protein